MRECSGGIVRTGVGWTDGVGASLVKGGNKVAVFHNNNDSFYQPPDTERVRGRHSGHRKVSDEKRSDLMEMGW